MDFVTAVRTCLTEKYAGFQGRASRPEYWWFFLAVLIAMLIASMIPFLGLLISLALICPAMAAAFRRLQDTGKPGWYAVIPAGLSVLTSLLAPDVPTEAQMAAGEMPSLGSVGFFAVLSLIQLAITVLFIWWLTRPTQPGPNAYGPPPSA